MKIKKDKIIKKWNDVGFLEKVKNKQNAALACEFTTHYFLNKPNNSNKLHHEVNILIFPAMIGIFRNTKKNLSVYTISNNVIEIIDIFYEKFKKYKKNKDTKSETKFISEFIGYYQHLKKHQINLNETK